MPSIGIIPLGPLTDAGVKTFLDQCAAPYPHDGIGSRRVDGLQPFLRYCAGSPFALDGVTRLNDIIPDTHSAAYRACTERNAKLSSHETDGVNRRLLTDNLLDAATASFVDMVETHDWPSGEGLILKGALVLARGLQPVEITRAHAPLRSDREGLLRSFIVRLMQSRRRRGPLLSTNISVDFVDAMLQATREPPVIWIGRVSEYQEFRNLNVEWKQPAPAHTQDVHEAVSHDARRRGGTGGFAYAEFEKRLLVAYGPSPGGHYYLHTPRQHAGVLSEARAHIEADLEASVAELERNEPSLADFRAERLYCKRDNDEQYRFVTRRLLFAWQYALYDPGPEPNPLPSHGPSPGDSPAGPPSAPAGPPQAGISPRSLRRKDAA